MNHTKILKTLILFFVSTQVLLGVILLNKYNFDCQIYAESVAKELSEIPQFRALAISVDGELILERYYNDEKPQPHNSLNIMSVTKSVTSLLIGIAIDKGFIKNINQPLSDFIDKDSFNINKKFADLTLQQMLTMKAGFDWNAFNLMENRAWIQYPDQLEYILHKPFIDEPGKRFNYNDGAIHLLSIILSEATGMNTNDFANEYLFKPLGIGKRSWYYDNRGYNMGGIGLILTITDMIKIGELVLNNGIYNGKRIISEKWIKESTANHTNANGYSYYANKYGYCWWTDEILGQPFVMAMGYGGQYILIFKELNLIIATLSNCLADPTTSFNNSDDIFNTVILKFVSKYIQNT